jgi:hypothetical protein
MGKQTSDSAQKGPGVTKLPTSAKMATISAPVKGVALPAPKLAQAHAGWNNGKGG